MKKTSYSSSDDSFLFLFAIAIAGFIIYGIWSKFHTIISYALLKITWFLLKPLEYFPFGSTIVSWRNELAGYAPYSDRITFLELISILNQYSLVFAMIPALLTIWALVKVMKHPANHTKRQINPEKLHTILAKDASAVVPLLYYGDLLSENHDSQKSALALDDWLKQHGLIVNGVLDRRKATNILISHLGTSITSLDDLNEHEKFLFTVFALCLSDDVTNHSGAIKLLDQANNSCHHGQFDGKRGYPDFKSLSFPFSEYKEKPELLSLLETHSYPRTLLHRMHSESLKKGKLPSSYFRWLKGMDRPLWYALNTTGRKTPFIESLAVFTQMRWEKVADQHGFKLVGPHLEDALDAIEESFKKSKPVHTHLRKTS